MKKLVFSLSVAMILGVVGVWIVPTDVQAQGTRPCCEGGFKPLKPCSTDDECQNVCVGGGRDGKNCNNTPCLAACEGGFKDGKQCDDDSGCPPSCVGGSDDGKNCDSGCAGGTCSNIGVCGPPGTCEVGTCTATCLKPGGPKSPGDPASQWQQFQDFLATLEADE